MPTISGSLLFVSSRAAQVSEVWVRAPKVRTHAEGLVTTGNDHFPVIDGQVEFTAVPGPAVLALISQGRAVDTVPIVVGESDSQTLRQVVNAAKIADDATKREIEKLSAQAIHLVDSSTENARKAQDGAQRAETAAGEAKQSAASAATSEQNASAQASSAEDSAGAAKDSATAAESSATAASSSASKAAKSANDAAGSATSAKQDADRAANIADSTSWEGDRLTVNGKTSPSLRGPKGDPGTSGASTWDAVTGKPTTFPPSGHTHKMEDISDLPGITYKTENNALVQRYSNGQIGVPIEPTLDQYATSKKYVDTAIASEKARTVGVTWTVPREVDVAARARVAQTGDYIQVAQSHTIYRVTSGGVEVERYGTRTLQASTDSNSPRNPNQWLDNDDPWAGTDSSRVSPPEGNWLVEIINPHYFAADLYVEGYKVATATSGTAVYTYEFYASVKSDVYVQIPSGNDYSPIALRFTPIN